MRDPVTYAAGELLLTVGLIAFAAFLAGTQHAERRHERDQERRDAARRRYNNRNTQTPNNTTKGHNQ